MHFWDAVVLMVAIGAFAWVRAGRHRSGGYDGGSDTRATPDDRERELEAEIVDLRKRIAVLERIATDERKSREIAAEIEALRERPPASVTVRRD